MNYINEWKIDDQSIKSAKNGHTGPISINLTKRLRNIFDHIKSSNKEKIDSDIIDDIKEEFEYFISKIPSRDIQYIKYKSLFYSDNEELANMEIPIIKSNFINNNYDCYKQFPIFCGYAFNVAGLNGRHKYQLLSCNFKSFTNVLKNIFKTSIKRIEYMELFFDIKEFDMPQRDEEFHELYTDVTGSKRYPSQFNVDFTRAIKAWNNYVGSSYKTKLKTMPIQFGRPSVSIINKFIIPFIEKYNINFIYIYVEEYDSDSTCHFMYDKSNDMVYYTTYSF